MNIVIIRGTIISKINFKFIYDRYVKKIKHTSITSCYVKLKNGSIIKVYGYDETADFMYRKLKFGDVVVYSGSIDNNGNIIVKEMYKK